jgi:hypothetical protein
MQKAQRIYFETAYLGFEVSKRLAERQKPS